MLIIQSMNNPKPFQRRIAIVLLAIFLPSLLPVNLIYANNNGPHAFEAASFEPVDATDMVNLATGDMSYVLPLLNVPSPEGGYPLALSYKAGIAMDQEASWVGLGWSLNPGAINRSVNGYADDISFGNDYTFVYDSGGELDYYNIGIGADLGGIKVGLGAYWGSNKTLGGSVSFGVGPAVASFSTGSQGTGVGVGYTNSVENTINNISNGVSFESFKKQGGVSSSQGVGSNNQNFSFSQDDYIIQVKQQQTGGVGFYYGHTKISYSLHKDIFNIYSGILYHNNVLNTQYNNYQSKYFDTNKLVLFEKDVDNILNINDHLKSINDLKNTLTAGKDQFLVNAQGLNGSISPYFNESFDLRSNKVFKNNGDSDNYFFTGYLGNQGIDNSMKLNSKLFFEFENDNSSFLRIDRSNIERDLTTESSLNPNPDSYKAYVSAKTNYSNVYNENYTTNGIPLNNGYRKRTGKYIEAFTNEQIALNSISFIEAKNLDRGNSQIYNPYSIGGFRVTDIDGKIYHYSLPVINFETWYKNFESPNNENDKFYENEKNDPYATDWLLTAITGPDYYDSNNNGVLDNEDYGYWIEFEYGKWTDGFIWQTSSGEHDIVKGIVDNKDRYEYYRGRKQIYYLDAVKTRSHTAYFVKSLRKDAQGKKVELFTNKANPTSNYNTFTNAKSFTSNYYENPNPGFRLPHNPSLYNIPQTVGNGSLDMYMGYKKNYFYRDFPQHYSLKLDKIILLANSSNINIDKSIGIELVSNKKAYYSKTSHFFNITGAYLYPISGGGNRWYTNSLNGLHTKANNPLEEVDIHSSHNVLDVNDIQGLNIENEAVKIVDFEYDPNKSLIPNSNNSIEVNKTRLALNAVSILGKNGVSYLPKYEFNYSLPSLSYNVNDEDGWGYNKLNPEMGSLKQIKLPLGSKIDIEYESDDYSKVASFSSRFFQKGLGFTIIKESGTNDLYITATRNNHNNDNIIEEFTSFNDYFQINTKATLDLFVCRRSKYGGHDREVKLTIDNILCEVTNVNDSSVTFKVPSSQAIWRTDDQDSGWICNRTFSLTSVKHLNGSNDGVIMRKASYRNCYEWRSSYDNDDVVFQYNLASTKTPSKGKGGGVRVKSVKVLDEQGIVQSRQNYYYNEMNSTKDPSDINYISSGSTSYVPYNFPVILPYASVLPRAMVLYKNVTVESYGVNNNFIGKTNYVFNTLGEYYNDPNSLFNLDDKIKILNQHNEQIQFVDGNLFLNKFQLLNNLSQLGNIMSISAFNSNNQLISNRKFNYKQNLDSQDELGVKQESFSTRYHKSNNYNVSTFSEVKYPSKIESIENTANGYTTSIYYDKHDFLTGEVLESSIVTSDGKKIKTKVKPAYTISEYSSMGSKVDNIDNRNMLSQTAATYSYIQDAGIWKETGVGITTWNNEWVYQDIGGYTSSPTNPKEKIWRKHKSYTWNGVTDANGIFQSYNSSTDDGFNWTVGVGTSQPSQWKQVSEVTQYSHYSMPLEIKDINGNKASTKMDVDDTKVMATGSAAYNELYYSGAETNYIGAGFWVGQEVRNANGIITSEKAHTGKYSIKATDASQFGAYMRNGHRPGKYKLSVWVHKDNAANARVRATQYGTPTPFNGSSYPAGDWVLMTHTFDVVAGDFYPYVTSANSSEVYFDDLMIRPIASSMTGYVYNEFDELTHIIGNNGLATRFEYDAAGRLVKTYVEVIDDAANGINGGFKLQSENKINYRNLN